VSTRRTVPGMRHTDRCEGLQRDQAGSKGQIEAAVIPQGGGDSITCKPSKANESDSTCGLVRACETEVCEKCMSRELTRRCAELGGVAADFDSPWASRARAAGCPTRSRATLDASQV